MTLRKCKDCSKEYSDDSSKCIHCGANNPKTAQGKQIIAVLVVGFILWFYVFGGLESTTNNSLDEIHQKVARDAEDQYRISKTSGDKIQICVQAGLVSAAHLQAKNDEAYRRWKGIEDADCTAAGMPQQ